MIINDMKISISRLRQILVEELEKYPGEPIKLPFEEIFLYALLFEKDIYEGNKFAESLNSILTKINYSNVNFCGFDARRFDFSSYTGIKINPQTIYKKLLNESICAGVEFIGPFDGVRVRGTNFKGSKGAKINPQTIDDKNLSNAICADVEFIGPFDGVNVTGTDFTGSNYEEAIKEENEFREKIKLLIYSNNIN